MKTLYTLLVFCLGVHTSYAQTGMWTWVNGKDTPNINGVFGTQGVAAAENTPPPIYEACEWKDKDGNFWLFGGVVKTNYNNWSTGSDLWKYNPQTNQWTWVKGPGVTGVGGRYGTKGVPSVYNMPPARGYGAFSWTDNNGYLWLYGGSYFSDDLWRYNIASNEWTWMKGDSTRYGNVFQPIYGPLQVATDSATPGVRMESAAAWTDNDGNLWLFGGETNVSGSKYFNDLWKFDIAKNQWIWMKGPAGYNKTGSYGTKGVEAANNCPTPRGAYARWKDETGNFYMMGGMFSDPGASGCKKMAYNDVWKYNLATNNWTWVSGESTYNSAGKELEGCLNDNTIRPPNTWENRAVCADLCGNAFMFGGYDADCSNNFSHRNTLWCYSSHNNEWTLLNAGDSANFGTKGVASAYNSPPTLGGSLGWYRDRTLWIFGGARHAQTYSSMWKYTIDTTCIARCAITDIPTAGSSNALIMYPNPASDILHLHVQYTSAINYSVTDMLGREVMNGLLVPEQKTINIETLPPGLYTLQLNNRQVAGRLVKQ